MLRNALSRVASANPERGTGVVDAGIQSPTGVVPEVDWEKRRTNAGSRQSGPSIMGILASRRLAKKLSTRAILRREKDDDKSTVNDIVIEREPTYRMEPKKKFSSSSVEILLKTILEERLEGFSYHNKFCSNMTKVLSEEIKDKVKAMHFDRYRIICMVCICERKDQSLVMTSRCTWDAGLDTFATYTYKNPKIYCTATVYGVYQE